jgi:hypothetical protein
MFEAELASRVFDLHALSGLGQLAGPVTSAELGRLTANTSVALSYAMQLAAAGLIISAIYLWHGTCQRNQVKEHCHG